MSISPVTQLLAMASAMDSVMGPMAMIKSPLNKKYNGGNKYAGMKKFSGKKETERRKRQLAQNS